MLSECTFPPGSVQLWVSGIGCTPSRAICFPGYHWLAPVGLCEEKLFWQDPGAQRSCWKLGEGQCLWNQESSGGVWEMASPRLWVRRCWDVTFRLQQRAGIHRDDHMAEEVQRDRRGWRFAAVTLREHVSWSYKFSWHLNLLSSCFQKLYISSAFGFSPGSGIKYIWPHTIDSVFMDELKNKFTAE